MTRGNDSAHPYRSRWDSATESMDIADGGLTKREYFAAMAMQGWISGGYMTNSVDGRALAAERSVLHADALIEALNKEKK